MPLILFVGTVILPIGVGIGLSRRMTSHHTWLKTSSSANVSNTELNYNVTTRSGSGRANLKESMDNGKQEMHFHLRIGKEIQRINATLDPRTLSCVSYRQITVWDHAYRVTEFEVRDGRVELSVFSPMKAATHEIPLKGKPMYPVEIFAFLLKYVDPVSAPRRLTVFDANTMSFLPCRIDEISRKQSGFEVEGSMEGLLWKLECDRGKESAPRVRSFRLRAEHDDKVLVAYEELD